MRGELGAFSVAEILQLIGTQEKTGILQIRSKGKSAVVFFDTGKVISARDRRQGAKDPFLFYLHENGAIGLEELNRLVETKQNDGGDSVDMLLGDKIVDEKTLGKLLSEYAVQTLESIVKWETGTYDFKANVDGVPEKSVMKPLRLEPILMEALRRKDEVEQIRRFLPSFDTKIKVSEPNVEELKLDDDDALILTLMGNGKTIDELIEESGMAEVETLDTLERLFALGVVSIAEKPRKPGQGTFLSPLRSILVAVAIVAVTAVLRLTVLPLYSASPQPLSRLRGEIAQFADSREVQNLHFALDAYRELNGTYPDNLEALVEADLLRAGQITNRYGDTYAYMLVRLEDRYVLSP
jgi:hypothetical protein